MRSRRSAALLLLVPVLLIAAWWIASDPGAGVDLPEVQAPADARSHGPTADPAAAAEMGAEALTDTEVAATPGRVEAKAGLALVGRVFDSKGAPVVGALVSCRADVDYRSLGRAGVADMAEAMERLQNARRDAPETTTAADGSFRLRAPVDDGKLRLRVHARGYLELQREVPRPTEADVEVGTFELDRGAVLAGRVVDSSGQPVARAAVRAVSSDTVSWFDEMEFDRGAITGGERRDETDARGRFELAHARPGSFTLRVSHAEHPPQALEPREIGPGEEIDDLLVVLAPGGEIQGRVSGAPAGEKIKVYARHRRKAEGQGESSSPFGLLSFDAGDVVEGLGIGLGNRSVELADDGTFTLRGLDVAKSYLVWAVQSGSGFVRVSACTDSREVPAGTRGVELRYAPGVSVAFAVVDAATGKALTELRVDPGLSGGGGLLGLMSQARGPSKDFEDYPGGMVTIANLRPKKKQKLDLGLEALGYAPLRREGIELPVSGTLELGTLRLTRAPLLRVHVTAGDSGRPIVGARVQIRVVSAEPASGTRGSISFSRTVSVGASSPAGGGYMFSSLGDHRRRGETDAEGWCVLNSFPGETVTIVVDSDDHAQHHSDAQALPAKGDHEYAVGMVRGGLVDVLVLDADNRPVAEASVRQVGPDKNASTKRSDVRGVARFEHLLPGQHRFKLQGGGAGNGMQVRAQVEFAGVESAPEPGWEEVVVIDGEAAELTLTKPLMGMLSGMVRENGLPLARARVTFAAGSGAAEDLAQARMAELSQRMQSVFGGASANGRADGEGHYELKDLPAGEHRLRVSHPDRAMTSTVPVLVREGEQTFDIDLTTTILSGRVLGPDGQPIDRATVWAVPDGTPDLPRGLWAFGGAPGGNADGQVKTNADGRYELRGVRPNEDLVVRARADGFAEAASAKVHAQPGQTAADVDVALSPAGRVSVRITGDAPPFAMVNATFRGPTPSEETIAPVMTMLRGGKATLEGLHPGRWQIAVSGMGDNEKLSDEVDVVAGETAKVEFAK